MKKLALCLVLFFSAHPELFAASAPSLPTFKIDPGAITISGISSGAYMAVQMDVAYSKTFSGVASIAGGVFWCAKGDSKRAQNECMGHPEGISTSEQMSEARRLAQAGSIDPLQNLASQHVYVYASPDDSIIKPVNGDKLVEFYSEFMNPSQIRTEHTVRSAHGFPTLNEGNPCAMGFLPWLLKCNYDGAGEVLKSVSKRALNPPGSFVPNHLRPYSQEEFGSQSTPLFAHGWVYVPESCAQGETCSLHVALHGCQMNPDYIQDKFARLAGYNEWAETNHMIILYPQSAKLGQANPYACWDWFGFTGQNYVTQSGAQMRALKKMVDRLIGSP